MDIDRESSSESLKDWKAWLRKRLRPVLLFGLAAALGHWLPLAAFAIVVGWLFLIILAQLFGSHSEPSETPTSASSDTDVTT